MADIPLRTYVQQLDNLIERKQIDEVIAHCRHILGLYPKHLDTYRMLGKALLEKGRHGDAADIFQRVLSVLPDDFISHVGMSIVREDEANLDSAIWHMERAFESAPANGAIQQELCRLYGRRDGVAPTKARLTRGALARMYAQGGLYLQAEAELKAALVAETDRIDLLTKLADVYWQTDQPAQAAQTSAAILQRLPYSLEANRILVNVFRAQGRANDAVVYRQRLEALDPYEAFADPAANGAGAARVDAAKVAVARLEYVPGMEDSGSPDWLASIGAKFEEPASARAPEAQPEWLSGATENPPAAADYQPGQGSVPDWLKDLDSGPAGTAEAPASPPPDWLKDMAAATAPQTAASNSSNEGLPDWLTTATGPLPADTVPDWMLQGADQASLEAQEAGTAPLLDQTLATAPTDSAPVRPSDTAPTIPVPTADLAPLEPGGEVPDWLKATAADEGDEELPDWLKAITREPLPETQPESQTPLATTPATTATPAVPPITNYQLPTPTLPEPAVSPTTNDELPITTPPEPAVPPITNYQLPITTAPEPAVSPITNYELPTPTPPEPAQSASPSAPATEATSLGDLPDWLTGAADSALGELAAADAVEPTMAVEPPAPLATPVAAESETASAAALAPGLEMPDWLKNVAPPVDPTAGHAAGGGADEAATPLGDEDLPDWLKAASALPAQEQTPVWLQTAPAGPSLVESQADQEPAMEIPDWLKDISASAPPADAGQAPAPAELGLTGGTEEVATPSIAPAPELPDYLQIASPQAIARAAQPLEMEPEAMEPEEDEPAAALPAEIPDWLKALAPVSPDAHAPILATSEPAPAKPAEAEAPAGAGLTDSLSWMDELTAPVAATAETPTGEPAAEETPPWLAAPAASAAPETPSVEPAAFVAGGLADDTLAAEIPPWAQNEEPGPSDTIASWLAGKHVPDWLRQPANDAPGLPAVEWEPSAAEAAAAPAAMDSLEAAVAAETTAPAEAPAPPTMAEAATPDLEAMDPEAAFRWLESLAAQQGAKPEELFTAPAEPTSANVLPEPMPAFAEPTASAVEVPPVSPAEPAMTTAAASAPEPGGPEDFLKQTEAAMPVEHLVDTAPSKPKPPVAPAPEPATTTEPAASIEPASPSAGAPAEAQPTSDAAEVAAPESISDFDADAAMRWLEGLAAQQGANPEELLTAPEERTLEAPQWVADELAAQTSAPTPAPSVMGEATPVAESAAVPAHVEPPTEIVAAEAVSVTAEALSPVEPSEATAAPAQGAGAEALSSEAEAEAAMRWLEGLAAQQGANPEELLTAPEERTLETPAWISAATAQAAADQTQPATEASPFEAVAPAAPASMSAALEAEPEPAPPEPEPAAAPETPEWLKGLVPTEDEVSAPAAEAAASPEAAPSPEDAAPATPLVTGDLDKLSRLAERLAASRRAREAEMEARFADQRNQQEAARRWVEERLEAKQAEPEPAADVVSVTPTPPTPPVQVEAEPAETTPAVRPLQPQPAAEPSLEPAPAMPPVTATAAAEALASGQAALSGQDYATAVAHLSVVVEQGQHLDTVVRSLEDAAATGRAPVPVLQLLGDAYLRTDQLQKALDSYRQALRRL